MIETDRIGPVRIGAGVSSAKDLAGWTIQDSCRWAAFWGGNPLQMVAAGNSAQSDPAVEEIAVIGDSAGDGPHTQAGLGSGSSVDEVRAAFPGAEEGRDSYGPWIRTGDAATGSIFFSYREGATTVSQITVTKHDKPSSEYCG